MKQLYTVFMCTCLSTFTFADGTAVQEWLDIYRSQLSPPSKMVLTRQGNETTVTSIKTENGDIYTRVDLNTPAAITTFQQGSRTVIWYRDKELAIDMSEVQKTVRSDNKAIQSSIESLDENRDYVIRDEEYNGIACVSLIHEYSPSHIELLYKAHSAGRQSTDRAKLPHSKVVTLQKENGRLVGIKELDRMGKEITSTEYKSIETKFEWKLEDFSPPSSVPVLVPQNQGEMLEMMSNVPRK